MRPVVPRHVAETAQTQIGLVDQGGRLQGVARPLRTEMPRRDRAELRVNQRQEPLQRAVIPLLPGPENLRDLARVSVVDGAIIERNRVGVSLMIILQVRARGIHLCM
jgi:hypothetical protein